MATAPQNGLGVYDPQAAMKQAIENNSYHPAGAGAMSQNEANGLGQQATQARQGANAMTQNEANGLGQQTTQARQGANAMTQNEATGLGVQNEAIAQNQQAEQQQAKDAQQYKAQDVIGLYNQQAQLANSNSQAAAQTQQALTAQRAAQSGVSSQQALGLGEFAALETQAQGAQQQAQIAQSGAQAQLQQNIKAYDTNYQKAQADRTARMTQLTDLLKSGNLSTAMRNQVVAEMVNTDPNDPIAKIYQDNPELLDSMLRTSDLKADFDNKNAAVGAMQAAVLDFGDPEQVNQFYATGQYTKLRWPDATKLEQFALAWTPTQKQIDAYAQATGKQFDANSLESRKDIYAYSDMAGNAKRVGDEQIFANIQQDLMQNGITAGVTDLEKLKTAMPYLTSVMSDVNVDGYNVKWSADTKNGGLAPLFQAWDGKEQGGVEDSNMDHLFWATNQILADGKQSPQTMSAFGSQFSTWLQAEAQKDPALANILSAGSLSQSDVQKLAQRYAGTGTSAGVKANLATITDPVALIDAVKASPIAPGSLDGLSDTQWNALWSADEQTKIRLEQAGYVNSANPPALRLNGNWSKEPGEILKSMQGAGIRIGAKWPMDGKVYTVKYMEYGKDSKGIGDKSGFRIIGTDAQGNRVELLTAYSSGFHPGSAAWHTRYDNSQKGFV